MHTSQRVRPIGQVYKVSHWFINAKLFFTVSFPLGPRKVNFSAHDNLMGKNNKNTL